MDWNCHDERRQYGTFGCVKSIDKKFAKSFRIADIKKRDGYQYDSQEFDV